jgi:hypothetical protein
MKGKGWVGISDTVCHPWAIFAVFINIINVSTLMVGFVLRWRGKMIFKPGFNVPNTVHNKHIKCVKHEDELDTHHEIWSLHNDNKNTFLILAIC